MDGYSGRTVSGTGDINGDGYDDVIVGAPRAANGSGDPIAGAAYVVYGNSGGFASAIDLGSLNGTNGFLIDGLDFNNRLGADAAGLGDVNGDGIDDWVVGANRADTPSSVEAGSAYVVFGNTAGFGASLDLSGVDGTSGFRLDGIRVSDDVGEVVGRAGDINGDGFDDVLIGLPGRSPIFGSQGEAFLLFGKSGGFASAMDLPEAGLNSTQGFTVEGYGNSALAGASVSGAEDVNGDGFDDLIVGSPNGRGDEPFSGEAYVIFGGTIGVSSTAQIGDETDNTFTATFGAGAVDILIGGLGDDVLISDGGADVLRGGEGDDTLAVPDTSFNTTRRLVGGNGIDTLRLDGSSLTLDLTAIADNRIVDVEEIDIRGSGDNTLVLDVGEVLGLSSHSNMLLVRRDAGDLVDIGSGWSVSGVENIDGVDFNVFAQGEATVKLEQLTGAMVIVESDGATVVDESGTTDSFTVELGIQPATDVVVTATSGDTSEATVDVTSLTFTSSNWDTPQTVTVTGQDDPNADGDQSTLVTLSIDDALSDDVFDPFEDQTVSVTITDDETAGFQITESGGATSVSETGTTDTFDVVLLDPPIGNVVIDVSSGDTGEATVDLAMLTFTPANWDTVQTVTVTGVDDGVLADGDVSTLITLSINDALSQDAFDSVADQIVSVTTTDNDVAGFSVTEPGGTTSISETGTTDTFDVVLDAQPVTDVVIIVNNPDTGEVSANVASLTFTNANWDTPRP